MARQAGERVQIKPSSLRGLQFATALALFTISITVLHAQDAIRATLRGDDAYRARSEADYVPPETALHAGPVLFQASLAYGLEWNDNIFLTPSDREDDLIHRPQFNLTAIWPVTDTSRLSLGLGLGYRAYTRHSELNGLTIAPLSALAWDIKVGEVMLTLYDSFSYSQEAETQPSIASGTAEFPRIENTVGIRARWTPSRYVFEAGYAHHNFISISSSATDFDYLDRSAELFFGRTGIRLADVSTAGLEFSSSLTDYRSDQQSDNVNFSIGPYLDWQVTDTLNLNLRGGWTFASYDPSLLQPTSEDVSSYYLNFRAQHKLTDHIQHELSISQGLQQALNVGSDYIESFRCAYNLSWAFHRSASLTGNVFYQQDDEPQLGVSQVYDLYGAGLGLGLKPTERLGVNLGYRYTTRTADQPNSDYHQNVVLLDLTYRF